MALPFIERPELLAELSSASEPVVVVTGPPGAGKSRLVDEWTRPRDPVWVHLAEVGDADSVVAGVAVALGSLEDATVESVGHQLRGLDDVTIVFDGADRVVGVIEPIIDRWTQSAPQARFVITSRQRLASPDAAVIEVGPMTTAQALALFAKRAQHVRHGFALEDDVRGIVVELVQQLDCIPLAIELAAARMNALGPAELLERLPQRFRVLRGRDQTLHQAIGLSWDLLDAAERAALEQCVVFVGGFDARAAEAIIDLDEDGPWVVDVLQGLVEKSLLRSSTAGALVGVVRFELLVSIREFVLDVTEVGDAVSLRHARYYEQASRDWVRHMSQADGETARARLEIEHHNLVAAFHSAAEAGETNLAVDLALTLDKAFRLRGGNDAWRQILERALALADGAGEAWVLRALGEFHLLRGDFDAATTHLERAADAARQSNESVTVAWTAFLRGEVERRRGRPADAQRFLEQALAEAADQHLPNLERMALGHLAGCLVDIGALDDARNAVEEMARHAPSTNLRDEARLLKRVAYAQYYLGNTDEQIRLTRRALDLARAGGDRRLEALCIQGLGDAAFVQSDFDSARASWQEALVLHRIHGSAELEGALLGNLGNLEHRLGRLDEARAAYSAALEIHAFTGARPYEAVVRFGLGVLELEQRHFDAAERMLERSAQINEEIGNVSDVGSCHLVRAWVAEAQGASGHELRRAAATAFEKSGDDDWQVLCEPDAQPDDVSDPTVRACLEALSGQSGADAERLHVRAAIARGTTEAADADILRVARGGDWFEVGGERVNMRRRRAPRYILARLAQLCDATPGEALDVEEAFEVGWPDEVATVEAANDRVYWAIRTLRKLGLEGHLLTSGDGYLLEPSTVIVPG